MTKKDIISFEVIRDKNAEPTRTYILRVIKNGVCIEAPRFEHLFEATSEVAGYINEFPLQKKFKLEINID
jgi:hypothetical protein